MMSGERLSVVLLDWDGTLVDSAESSFLCYRRLFNLFGIDFDRRRFETTYSPDWYATYRTLGLPELRWAEADALWLKLYETYPSRLVQGAHDALDLLTKAGLRLGLVTSGNRTRVHREMVDFGVEHYFSVLVCAHDVPQPKPSPEPVLRALALFDVPATHALYIGDSPEDVTMARAAGIPCIGVPGPFPNRAALLLSNPDHLVGNLAEAIEIVLKRMPDSSHRTSLEKFKKKSALGGRNAAAEGADPDGNASDV